jgi:hypothetical protein
VIFPARRWKTLPVNAFKAPRSRVTVFDFGLRTARACSDDPVGAYAGGHGQLRLALFLKRPHPFLGFLGAVEQTDRLQPSEEMPAMWAVSALKERLASSSAVGLFSRISAHQRSTSASSSSSGRPCSPSPFAPLRRRVLAAQIPDFPRPLLADHPRHVGGAEAGIDRTDLGADLAEFGRFGGQRQIAQQRQHVTAADGVAAHLGDHRLGHIADHALQFLQRQADHAAPVVMAGVGRLVAAGAKRFVPAPVRTMTPT